MTHPVEFDCQDCGVHVFSYGIDKAPDPPRCASCVAIRGIPAGPDREAVRATLYDQEAMQYWIEHGSFEHADDDAKAEGKDAP
jgi:hypothetical protein